MHHSSHTRPMSGRSIHPTPAPGDCLYHVLAQALTAHDKSKPRTHRQMRDWLHAYMAKKHDIFQPRWDGKNARGTMNLETFDVYLKQQQKSGTWATTLEVEAAALGLRQRIYVIDKDSGKVVLLNEEGASGHIAMLYSHAEGHFEWISGSDEDQLKAHTIPDTIPQAFRAGASTPALTDFASTRQKTNRTSQAAAAKSATLPTRTSKHTSNTHHGKRRAVMQNQTARPVQWVCDVCQRIITGKTIRHVSQLRYAHMVQQHPGMPRDRFHTIRTMANVVPALPQEQVAGEVQWQCAWCHKCLPWLDTSSRQASVREHFKHCQKAPANANRGKNLNKLLKDSGANRYQKKTPATRSHVLRSQTRWNTLRAQAQTLGHELIKPQLNDGHQKHLDIACVKCLTWWCSLGIAERKCNFQCTGQKGRKYHMSRTMVVRWQKYNKTKKRKMSEALQLTHKEVQFLKATPRPTLSSKHPWARDLTECGDVEPHPGSLKCASVNMQGRDNAYHLFEYMKPTMDVVCIQEVNMDEFELQQFRQHSQRNGYRCWGNKGKTQTDTRGRRITRGGIATLVKATLAAHMFHQHSSAEGDILAIVMSNMVLANVYQTHEGLAEGGLRTELTELQNSMPKDWSMVFVGDFNELVGDGMPQHLDMNPNYVREKDTGEASPSRWSGNRCIDWILTSSNLAVDEVHYGHEVFGDHKVLKFRCRHVIDWRENFEMVSTPFLVPHEPDIEWHRTLEQTFAAVTIPAVTDTETEWNHFNLAAQHAHLQALQQHGIHVQLQGVRNKGTEPWVRPKGPPRKPTSESFRGRRLANSLGRCRELHRQLLRDANSDIIDQLTRICQNKWPLNEPWSPSIQQNITKLEDELQKTQMAIQSRRLQRWRDTMRQGGKAATKWLQRKNATAPVSIITKEHDQTTLSDSAKESIQKIEEFWSTYWENSENHVGEGMEAWRQRNQPVNHTLSDNPLTVFDPAILFSESRRLKGSTAGPDGWYGDELATWPLHAWTIYSALVKRWVNREEFPRVWQHCRQSQIPKPEAEKCGGALEVKDLRPITIFSGLWRVLTSSMARHTATQSWAHDYLPAQCHGAVKKRSVHSAIGELEHYFVESQQVLASLDYSKCFDSVAPTLAIDTMKEAGIPAVWTKLLSHVWTRQRRWVQFAGCSAQRPKTVTGSLPQGDGMCPLALNILLASPVRDIMVNLSGRGLRMSTFLDDRNLVAPVHIIPTAIGEWSQWSVKLGLQENEHKMKIVCRKSRQKEELLRAGIEETKFADQARVLGVDFVANKQCAIHKTMQQRRQSAEAIAERLTCVKSLEVRRALWRSRVVSRAAWGHLCRVSSNEDWKTLRRLYKRIHYVQTAASVPLQKLLEGHGQDPQFQAGYWALRAWMRIHADSAMRIADMCKKFGTWASVVAKFLTAHNWQEQEPGCWAHEGIQEYFDWRSTSTTDVDTILHKVRESHREQLWQEFVSSDRRDAALIRATIEEAVYDPCQVQMARKVFQKQGSHGRAVMTGAFWSSAKRSKTEGDMHKTCPWCKSNSIPDTDHLFWQCPHFRETRPFSKPHLVMQCRFGWPEPGANQAINEMVVYHMAQVRSQEM